MIVKKTLIGLAAMIFISLLFSSILSAVSSRFQDVQARFGQPAQLLSVSTSLLAYP